MVFFIFIQILKETSVHFLHENSGEPDQTPRFAASDLGLTVCTCPKKDARLI